MRNPKLWLLHVLVSISMGGTLLAGESGTNLPPRQGDTDMGNFMPGIFNYDYTLGGVANVASLNFTCLRIGINYDTAMNPASLQLIQSYFAQVGYKGIICFWDTAQAGEGSISAAAQW